jgi:DNA polymerase I
MTEFKNSSLADFPTPKYEYITKTEDALRLLEKIERYPILEVDTEDTGFDPFTDKVVLLQIGVPGKSFVFDVRAGNVDASIFKNVFESNDSLKVLQNALFDYKMLKTNFGIELNRIYDTMLAEQLLFLGLNPKASLQYLVSKYFHLNMPKNTAQTFQKYNQEYKDFQLEYAAGDVSVLRDIYNLQLPQLKQKGLMNVAKLEFDFVKALAEMELNGIILDVAKWRGILDEMVIERDLLRSKVFDVLSPTVNQTTLFNVSLLNLDSPVQLVKSLNKLGIDVDSTNIKVLSRYKDNPIVKLILDYRKYEKFITTYGEALISKIHPKTGRLHTDFTQMVSTGRLSSRDPNLQNIPKDQKYRSCFVADSGYKLVTSDMGSAELRIIADMANDPTWIHIFNSGGDLHTISAARIFGVTEEEVLRDKSLSDDDPNKKNYRGMSKAISFGVAYGLTEHGLSIRLGITENKATEIIDGYFKIYPKIEKFLNDSGKFAVINRYSISNSGRRRFYNLPSPDDPTFNKIRGSVERAGRNMRIQAGNADAIKKAMIYVVERLKDYDAKLLLTVHDEIIVESREDITEEVSDIVSTSMIDGFAEFFKSVKMKTDTLIGDCWLKG